jgi:hypothetical protein
LTARAARFIIPPGLRRFRMSESGETEKESTFVIQEIENQLERLLARKKDEIDGELAARIREEQEAARARMDGVEKEISLERESLREFQTMVSETEGERQAVLEEIRAGFSRALDLQSQIEGLVKRTVEEIGKVGDLQWKLESRRRLILERAAFLKKDLQERFGIVADARGEEERRPEPAPDLDAELEKLKRIRTLLAGETEGRPGPESSPGSEPEDAWPARIPEIRELIEAMRPVEDARPAETPPGLGLADPASALERLRRIEHVAGSGEISYFQQGEKAIMDAGRFLDALGRTVDVARKLAGKLEETESPRDRFFIKQEIINGQEGLRNLVLRAAKLCGKGAMALPPGTLDVLDTAGLRSLFDRLSVGNWANAADLAAFTEETRSLRVAFEERTVPPERYYLSILEELDGVGSVERPGSP